MATVAELRDRIAGLVVTDVREPKTGGLELHLAGEKDGEGQLVMVVMGAVVNTELRDV